MVDLIPDERPVRGVPRRRHGHRRRSRRAGGSRRLPEDVLRRRKTDHSGNAEASHKKLYHMVSETEKKRDKLFLEFNHRYLAFHVHHVHVL